MKKLSFFLILWGVLVSQPLKIDVRTRIVNEKTINVIVQIDNHSKRTIASLEGFVVIKADDGNLLEEKRLMVIGPLDPALHNEQTVSKNLMLEMPDPFPRYEFNVSKIKFSGDYKIYTYHPQIGFYRID